MDIKSKRIYKALVVDVDGTLVSNEFGGKISQKVRETIIKSRAHITFSIASGRPLERVTFIFDELGLKNPCIVSGGAQIVDPVTRDILWEQPILPKDTTIVTAALATLPNKIWVIDSQKESLFDRKMPVKRPLSFFIPRILEEKADALIHYLSPRKNVSVTKVVAYHEGCVAIQINHAKATKQHAITKLAELLQIKDVDIIGVGDGHNDFPLFEACGLKIAVGNAITSLKEKADYVAPSVSEDAIAHVIEKFIFKSVLD
jgi:HAD superfamily hydrolase (TIGR01484 family)